MGTSKVRCDEQLVILVVLNASNLWHDIHFLHVLPTFDNVGVQTVELVLIYISFNNFIMPN